MILGKPLLHSDPVAPSVQWRIRPVGPQECFGSFSVLPEDSRDRRGARSLNILAPKKLLSGCLPWAAFPHLSRDPEGGNFPLAYTPSRKNLALTWPLQIPLYFGNSWSPPGRSSQSGHSSGTLEPRPSALPASICSPLALCLRMRLDSGDCLPS